MVGQDILVYLRIKNMSTKLSLVFLLILSWFSPFPGLVFALFPGALILYSQGPLVSAYLLVILIIPAAVMVWIRD